MQTLSLDDAKWNPLFLVLGTCVRTCIWITLRKERSRVLRRKWYYLMNPLCVFALHGKRGIPYRKKCAMVSFLGVIGTTLLSMHKTVHSSALAYILLFSRSRSFCTSCMRYTKWNCPLLQHFCWKPFVAQTSVTKSTTGRFILIVDFTLISISWWWSLIRNMKEVENIIQLPIELFSFPQYSRLPAQARH